MAQISKDIQELVLKRVETIPIDAQLVTAAGEAITKVQLIEHIQKLDEIGTEYIEMEMFYIRSKAKLNSCLE